MNERAAAFLKAKFYSGQITGEELMRRVEAEVRRDIAAEVEQLRGERDETAADLAAARDELAKWRTAMQSIAIQKLSTEMNPTGRDVADFETGYDMCVEEARRALAAGQGEGAGM